MVSKSDRKLYSAIYKGMRYWFARIILEQSCDVASAFSRHVSLETRLVGHLARRRARRRRVYKTLRDAGFTPSEAQVVIRGGSWTVGKVDEYNHKRHMREKARWGGHPKPGTQAWVRREQAKLAAKLGIDKED